MRLPNGYGSVVDLGKNRRKRYAVRITVDYTKNNGKDFIQKYKYLEYFTKSDQAYQYLAKYNAGQQVKEHVKYTEQPTFKEVYEKWEAEFLSRQKQPSQSAVRNYRLAFKKCSDIQNMKMINIKVNDLESVVSKYSDKSKSTNALIKSLLNKIYQYSMKHEYIDKDYSSFVSYEYSEDIVIQREEFTAEEIQFLWDNIDKPYIDIILMMIYTGFRPSEFLSLENKNIHLNERYIVGGIKTDAGKNRTVPIHKKVLPLFEKRVSDDKYFLSNPSKKKYSYPWFHAYIWTPATKELNINHSPYDTRHTMASMLDRSGANKICIKLIMGHKIKDITDGVYTHKNLDDLLEAIDLI